MTAIEVSNLARNYGDHSALRNITISIPQGTLFGIIGPDGAGKTTLLRIITSLLLPDSGFARVFGMDVVKDFRKIRNITGYMPGRFSLYPDLTVEENLRFYAMLFGTTIRENYDLIEPVFSLLEPFRKRLAKNLSGGMKQKLALSCALIHKPSLLVLDEPTTGVDAVSRREFWDNLKGLKSTGMTILVSTPYMDEASRCDEVALLQEGEIMQYGTPAGLLEDFSSDLFSISGPDLLKVLRLLRNSSVVENAYLFGSSVHASVSGKWGGAGALKELFGNEAGSYDIQHVQPEFEDCFIAAVKSREQ